MLEAALITINLATNQLCAKPLDKPSECYPIVHGCKAYPTPTGTFNVEKIYTNASLVSFYNGRNLGSNIIGGLLVDLGPSTVIPGARFALHGWHQKITDTSTLCSHSCIRANTEDLRTLINTYSFSSIDIIPYVQ